jgi:uncharacterized protein with LGFP repeats
MRSTELSAIVGPPSAGNATCSDNRLRTRVPQPTEVGTTTSTGGAITWARAAGAHETHGPIRAHWGALGFERGLLGFPITDQTPTPDRVGQFTHFEHGSIYWTAATGAHEVHGTIRDKWAALGRERSLLGSQFSDEYGYGDGRRSDFQHGYLYRHAATGAVDEVLLP